MLRRSLLVPVALLLAAVPGCSRGPEMAEVVEGTVTLAGKPLEKVRVNFSPLVEGPESTALTDDQGRFVLATVDGKKQGAAVGMHKVILRDTSIVTVPFAGRANEEVDMTGGKKPRIAEKYASLLSTPLEIEVKGDTSDLKLEVEPYAGRGR